MQYVLILVYMLSGDLVVEKSYFPTEAACQVAGGQRTAIINANPGFEGGYLAGCLPVKAQKV